MSTHNICFVEKLENINTFGLKKASYQELSLAIYLSKYSKKLIYLL